MTSYHRTGNGTWARCRAVKRKGAGVSLCPLLASGVQSEHRKGLEGIAASGGGILRRWIAEDTYRETRITVNGDGTFEAATGKRKSVFTMDGKLRTLRERVRGEKIATVSEPAHIAPIAKPRPKWRTDSLEALIATERANLNVEASAMPLAPELAAKVERDVCFSDQGRTFGQFRLYRDGRAEVGLRIPGAVNDRVSISVKKDQSMREEIERNFGYRSTYRGEHTFGIEELVRVRFAPAELARILAVFEYVTDEVENYRDTEEILSLAGLENRQLGGGDAE